MHALACTAFATVQHHPGARTTLSAACDDLWVPYLMHLTRLCWRSARLSGPDLPTSSSRDCAHGVYALLRRLLATCGSHTHAEQCPAHLRITPHRSMCGWQGEALVKGGTVARLVFWLAPLRLLDSTAVGSGAVVCVGPLAHLCTGVDYSHGTGDWRLRGRPAGVEQAMGEGESAATNALMHANMHITMSPSRGSNLCFPLSMAVIPAAFDIYVPMRFYHCAVRLVSPR